MYSYGPRHMAVQKQDDQHEHTFSNYVRIQDVVQKTCLRRWTIGKSGERGSGISVLPAQHDDDDDDIYNHLICKDDIKLFAKSEYELETLILTIRIYNQDIGIKFLIEKCVMLIRRSGKRQMTEGIELLNLERIRTLCENNNNKQTYKYLRISEVDYWGWKKNDKSASLTNDKASQNLSLLQESN